MIFQRLPPINSMKLTGGGGDGVEETHVRDYWAAYHERTPGEGVRLYRTVQVQL